MNPNAYHELLIHIPFQTTELSSLACQVAHTTSTRRHPIPTDIVCWLDE